MRYDRAPEEPGPLNYILAAYVPCRKEDALTSRCTRVLPPT